MTYTPTHPYTHACRHAILHWTQKRDTPCCLSAQQEKQKMTFFHSNWFYRWLWSRPFVILHQWSDVITHTDTLCLYWTVVRKFNLKSMKVHESTGLISDATIRNMLYFQWKRAFCKRANLIMCNYMHIAIFAYISEINVSLCYEKE